MNRFPSPVHALVPWPEGTRLCNLNFAGVRAVPRLGVLVVAETHEKNLAVKALERIGVAPVANLVDGALGRGVPLELLHECGVGESRLGR